MKPIGMAVVGLYIFNALLWGYLAVGLMAWDLQGGELLYASAEASCSRAQEEGLTVAALTPSITQEMRDRYGITNRGGHYLHTVEAATLTEFLEAARVTGVVYMAGATLYVLGRRDLVTYSPVIRGRLWPYTVEWVNQ